MMGEKLAMPARHGLVGAANKTNRVFRDKPGGLVVDYLGLAHELKALHGERGRGPTALDQDEAVALMFEKYEVCCALFHGFDWSRWVMGTPQERLGLLPSAKEHILKQENARVIPVPLASADIRVRLAR
jgi:type I restriction enzyme, R subunit